MIQISDKSCEKILREMRDTIIANYEKVVDIADFVGDMMIANCYRAENYNENLHHEKLTEIDNLLIDSMNMLASMMNYTRKIKCAWNITQAMRYITECTCTVSNMATIADTVDH